MAKSWASTTMAFCADTSVQPEPAPEPHANDFMNDWSDLVAPWNENILSLDIMLWTTVMWLGV